MMGYLRFFFLALTAMFFGACSADSDPVAEVPAVENGDYSAAEGNTLVVYYSYTGNCRDIVQSLNAVLSADVLEITPAEKGLKYEANNYALGTQLLNAIKADPDNADSYPGIDPVDVDMSRYDNIIVVTPLWWCQMAAIMQTFLFHYGPQMAGKQVALVVSSASSGISGVVADAKRLVPEASWMGDALWINNSNRSKTASLLSEWMATLNLKMESMKMNITIDGQTRSVTLVDNAATQTLVQALKETPITFEVDDYGGFEKVGDLGRSLPTANEQITTEPGDVILYSGDQIVLFYGSNSWSYTRLGHIDNATVEQLKSFLKAGKGTVSVTLSVGDASAVSAVQKNDDSVAGTDYSVTGARVSPSHKGVYIRNGKKFVK